MVVESTLLYLSITNKRNKKRQQRKSDSNSEPRKEKNQFLTKNSKG